MMHRGTNLPLHEASGLIQWDETEVGYPFVSRPFCIWFMSCVVGLPCLLSIHVQEVLLRRLHVVAGLVHWLDGTFGELTADNMTAATARLFKLEVKWPKLK